MSKAVAYNTYNVNCEDLIRPEALAAYKLFVNQHMGSVILLKIGHAPDGRCCSIGRKLRPVSTPR